MTEIGVRELKAKASEILRRLREEQARYTVTYHGKAVAVLIPLERTSLPTGEFPLENADAVWDELVDIGKAIAAGWESEKNSTELLSEMRR